MKSEPNSDTPERAVASVELLARLRGGELEYCEEDVLEVMSQYAQTKNVSDTLKTIGFGWLPDPADKVANEIRDMEEWLIDALGESDSRNTGTLRTPDEYRVILHQLVESMSEG
jgi:hypothetical protein